MQMQAQSDDSDIVHVVVAGESLSSISLAYGLTVENIATNNGLDPEAFLQVGQRLRIIYSKVPESAEPDPTASAPTIAEDEAELEPSVALGKSVVNDSPPAPVIAAAVDMQDPTELDSSICFTLFLDDSLNGYKEPDEFALAEGALQLSDSTGENLVSYQAEGSAEFTCIENVQRQVYLVTAMATEGYEFTGPSRLRVDLRDGLPVRLYFGTAAESDIEEPPAFSPPPASADVTPAEPTSLLRELSGLFVLALAAFVLVTGLAAALIVRMR